MNTDRISRNTWFAWGLLELLVLVGLSSLGGVMLGHAYVDGNCQVAGAPWLWGIGLFGLFGRLPSTSQRTAPRSTISPVAGGFATIDGLRTCTAISAQSTRR